MSCFEILQLKSVRFFVWNISLPDPQPAGAGQFLFSIKSQILRSPPASSNIEGFTTPINHFVRFDLESLFSKNDVEQQVHDAILATEQFLKQRNVTALAKILSEFLVKNYGLGLGLGLGSPKPNSPIPVVVVEVNKTWVINPSGDYGGYMMDEVGMFDGCDHEAANEESIHLSLRNLFAVSVFSVLKPIDGSEPLGLRKVPRLDSFQQFESAAAADPDDDTSCAICLEGFSGNPCFKLPCSHVFHGECVAQWLWRKRSCPLCRFQLS
ncbi:Zinc finger, RING-type [Corchorus capsularis]|uniref:Zinc finger, RING-type n=1 Tax=Corchorus capsularis TaxID=210143 RepID=A0A1R3HFB0_COCAP|nr:Zinc finger, RING-type [Corchorus capsularis]